MAEEEVRVMNEDMDIEQVLRIYRQRVARFKHEMEELGIKVNVTASLKKCTSTVEEK